MKVLLIIGSMPNKAPYLNHYIELFKVNHIVFDVICWNRNSDKDIVLPENYILYNKPSDIRSPFWKKFFDLYYYALFIKKRCKSNNYNLIVVFTIAECIFLQSYLKKKYENRYIFDIRDYSPLMKIAYFRKITEKMIAHSSFTVISSKGFLNWLPQKDNCRYVITHNIDEKSLKELNKLRQIENPSKPCQTNPQNRPIHILTIGQLRDFESNSSLIRILHNNPNYMIYFSGSGIAEKQLKEFSNKLKAENVVFTGYYRKEEEAEIVEKSDMINILFNHNINSNSLMSNRFYLSVIHRKPMIVRSDTFQAELVQLYKLGVVVNKEDDLICNIENFWRTYDFNIYNQECSRFLNMVIEDINNFDNKMLSLLNSAMYNH